jgi:hypothetical protein
MGWSQIEGHAVNDCRNSEDIAEELSPCVTSLQKLESTDVASSAALSDNTLADLTWVGRHKADDLKDILEHQGASFQRLECRCDELSCPSMRNSFNMLILPQLAPNLVHVSVNIPRNGTWPLEDFTALTELPELRSLEVYSQLRSELPATETGILHGTDAGVVTKAWRRLLHRTRATSAANLQREYC